MTSPFRKPGECLPDLPEPPGIRLPKGRGVWVNMLEGRGRDLRKRSSSLRHWLSRFGLVEVLVLVAASAILAVIVLYALNAPLKDLESGCSCSCSPQPCSCSCNGNDRHWFGRSRLWDD